MERNSIEGCLKQLKTLKDRYKKQKNREGSAATKYQITLYISTYILVIVIITVTSIHIIGEQYIRRYYYLINM